MLRAGWRIPVAICAALLATAAAATNDAPRFDTISADSLRATLSYLASDELEGRGTPSSGLDRAADYLAGQFQRAGLRPAVDGTYFQLAHFEQHTVEMTGFRLRLATGSRQIDVKPEEVLVRAFDALDYSDAPVVRLPANGPLPGVSGRIVAGDERRYGAEAALAALQAQKPSLILLIAGSRRVAAAPAPSLDETGDDRVPVIRIRQSDALSTFGNTDPLVLSVHLAKPGAKAAEMRNVVAILPGSDPDLRNQFILVTAHYDHLGRTPKGIFHGANDNASGAASVVELARAFAALNPAPKRSIVFATFFGEEEGLLGALYFVHHPPVSLKETVADVNLEQMGRTDEPGAPRISSFAFTGPSFSDLPAIMGAAAKSQGIAVYGRADADSFFGRSDNYAFAQAGIVAHTIAVAFDFPDYHALGDTTDKIDFSNMAAVDRGVAAGILALADNRRAPQWSNANTAVPYRNVRR